MAKWMIVLPPEGAARQVGEYTVEAFSKVISDGSTRVFDTKTYLTAFDSLLKNHDDDITVDLLNQSLIVNCLDARITHCLVLALSPITLFCLQLLRRQGIQTIHWFYEDYRVAQYWRDVLTGYDYFFGVQRGELSQECQSRGIPYFFLQTAGTPHLPSIERKPPLWDCVFVGIPSTYRVGVLESLYDAGISLAICGEGWNNYSGRLQSVIVKDKWTSHSENIVLYQQTKVALNLSNSDPSSNRKEPQISPRVFDILATSASLVIEELELSKEVLSGFSYHTFRTLEELISIIKRAQQQPPELVQLHQKQLDDSHQYTNRVRTLISQIQSS